MIGTSTRGIVGKIKVMLCAHSSCRSLLLHGSGASTTRWCGPAPSMQVIKIKVHMRKYIVLALHLACRLRPSAALALCR
jgi:hypothetical protein